MFPFHIEPEDRRPIIALGALALVQAAVLLVFAWFGAGGHFMLPLDDSYIHLQYAKRLAAGFPLSYSTGMDPSGGMTSPLYVLLLAPAFLVGLHGVKGAAFAFLLGAALWALLVIWVYQLGRRLSNTVGGLFAALLVIANGHLLWNALSGMETCLFMVLLVGAVLGAQSWWQSEDRGGRVLCLACLAGLPLVRPEGAVAVIALLIVALGRRREHPHFAIPVVLLCLAPLIAWFAILKIGTGDWRPAGLVVKGLTGNPHLEWHQKITLALEHMSAIATRFHQNLVPDDAYAAYKGTQVMPYMAPGMVYLSLLGAGFAMVGEWRTGKPAAASFLALLWVGGLAATATSHIPFIHQQRYLAPWTVAAIIFAVVGAWRFSQLFQQYQETAMKAVLAALLVMSIPSVGFWTAEYARNSRDIFHVLRVATFGIEHNGQPMAITDAGILAYYTDRPVVDLVGLTSREFTRRAVQGDGAALEGLATLPHSIRPAHLVGYREWFGPEFPLGTPRWLASVPRTSITSGIAIAEFPIHWHEIDAAKPLPISGGRIVQEVNVAELHSEAASVYTWRNGIYDLESLRWPQPATPVARFEIPLPTSSDTGATGTLALQSIHAVEGGRVVRGEAFVYTPRLETRGGRLTWHARVGRPFLPHSPAPAATEIALQVTSNTTGYTARRVVEIPEGPQAVTVTADLSDLMDEAGGTRWKLSVEAAAPHGAAWAVYRHWIEETNELHGAE